MCAPSITFTPWNCCCNTVYTGLIGTHGHIPRHCYDCLFFSYNPLSTLTGLAYTFLSSVNLLSFVYPASFPHSLTSVVLLVTLPSIPYLLAFFFHVGLSTHSTSPLPPRRFYGCSTPSTLMYPVSSKIQSWWSACSQTVHGM